MDKKLIVVIGVVSVLVIAATFVLIHNFNKEDYELYYDENGTICKWNYNYIDYFLPCYVNGEKVRVVQGEINQNISPEENCEMIGGEYLGVGVENEEVIYNLMKPKC